MLKMELDKKEQLMRIMLEEYGLNGYEHTSTNTIIKKAGISKGSLFNYFGNKFDQYTYLIDRTLDFFTIELANAFKDVVPPSDYLDFLVFKSQMKYKISSQYPNEFRFMMTAYKDNHHTIKAYMKEKANLFAKESVGRSAAMLDPNLLKYPERKDKIAGIIFYTIGGITDSYLGSCDDWSNPKILKAMTAELEDYVQVMRASFYK